MLSNCRRTCALSAVQSTTLLFIIIIVKEEFLVRLLLDEYMYIQYLHALKRINRRFARETLLELSEIPGFRHTEHPVVYMCL